MSQEIIIANIDSTSTLSDILDNGGGVPEGPGGARGITEGEVITSVVKSSQAIINQVVMFNIKACLDRCEQRACRPDRGQAKLIKMKLIMISNNIIGHPKYFREGIF